MAIGAEGVHAGRVAHDVLYHGFGHHVLHQGNEGVAERIHGARKVPFFLELRPVLPHPVLFALATVRRAEYPLRIEIRIIVSFDGLADDGSRQLSDRDHSARVLVLSFRYVAACVHGSFYVNAVFFDVIHLQAEDLARPQPSEHSQTEGGMVPELRRLQEPPNVVPIQNFLLLLLMSLWNVE